MKSTIQTVVDVELTITPVQSDGFFIQEGFLFTKLPEDVQQLIFDRESHTFDYPWTDENLEVITMFLEAFRAELRGYQYDSYSSFYRYGGVEDWIFEGVSEEFFKKPVDVILDAFPHRYTKKGNARKVTVNEDKMLTGYCLEYTCFKEIDILISDFNSMLRKDFYLKYQEYTLDDLITSTLDKVFEEIVSDVSHHYSFETFKETCEANQYCYTWDGDFVGFKESLIKPTPLSRAKTESFSLSN